MSIYEISVGKTTIITDAISSPNLQFYVEVVLSDNVIQIRNWLRSPMAFKGLDKQINNLTNKFEELLDAKYQTILDLDNLLQWAVDKKIDIKDFRFQEGLRSFSEAISVDEEAPPINTFADISCLIEEIDELILEKIVSLTEKRLESLRLKWNLVTNETI